jgi:hypothetical protein
MNDFASDDFLTKNIRVRPVSGRTNADDTKTGDMLGGPTRNALMTDNTDDEDNYNKMINLEMEDQRKAIKVKRDDLLRKQKLEEEKAKGHRR